MVVGILVVTVLVPLVVVLIVASAFRGAIERILARLIGEEMSGTWAMFVKFGVYVAGLSFGIPMEVGRGLFSAREIGVKTVVELRLEGMMWLVFRASMRTLQGVGFVLLGFFVVALLAYVIVAGFESKRQASMVKEQSAGAAAAK